MASLWGGRFEKDMDQLKRFQSEKDRFVFRKDLKRVGLNLERGIFFLN